MVNAQNSNDIETIPQTPSLLAEALAKDLPEVEYAVAAIPVSWGSKTTLSVGDNTTKAVGQYAGKDYLNIFSWRLLLGEKNTVLSDKNSIIISKSLALKLFHTTDNILGKTIEWQHERPFTITGIVEGTPNNSTIQFDYILPFQLFLDANPDETKWSNSDPNTYIVLKKGAHIDEFNKKIAAYVKSRIKESNSNLFARPFSKGYLYSNYENGLQAGGRISYVRLFSIIALFILIIACINFMNLSTAKASGRMKEVGIKKVIGARRRSLVFQYLGESMLLTFLSLMLAIVIILILLPQFNHITGKHISLALSVRIILAVLGITLITGIISGSYPALYLSGFRPATILKGKLKSSAGELWIRKGLVIFQFTLSVIFIIAVLVVYRQISYIQSKNLGYSRDNVIHFEIPFEMDSVKLKRAATFLDEVKNIPGVINASSYYHNLTGDHGAIGGFQWPGKEPGKDIEFANLEVGYNFIETLDIQIKEGRSFSNNQNAHNEIIFNEAAIQSMGLKDPI